MKHALILLPNDAPVPPTGLSIEEVSRRYRIPVPTLRKWRRQGHVEGPMGVLVGGQLRYLPEALELWDRQLATRGRDAIREAGGLAAGRAR
jgi:transposase-like protein